MDPILKEKIRKRRKKRPTVAQNRAQSTESKKPANTTKVRYNAAERQIMANLNITYEDLAPFWGFIHEGNKSRDRRYVWSQIGKKPLTVAGRARFTDAVGMVLAQRETEAANGSKSA